MPSSSDAPGVLGITGGIGVGKSTLSRFLHEDQGWPLLDADRLGHEALLPSSGLGPPLRARFGPGIFAADGTVRREKLARLVFGRPEALRDLNALVHPWIHARLSTEAALLRSRGTVDIILLDAALLLDWLGNIHVDWIAVVTAPLDARLRRLADRGMSGEEARRRIESQRGEAEFRSRARWVVENGGTEEELHAAARVLAAEVRRLRHSGSGDGRNG